MNYEKESLESRKNGSPMFTGISIDIKNKDDLSIFYSPGIAEPCRVIYEDLKSKNPQNLAKKLTIKKNTVAVISDGSAVLGLGNIGAEAGLPVMEGKCMLMKKFANVDAFPIVLKTQDTQEIINIIENIAPTFGAINLEDISAPRCFEIEEELSKKLNIPIFHDDQDGTAMVVLAALINSLKIVGKDKKFIKIVISGAGSAGIAIAKMLKFWGAKNILMLDSLGIIDCNRGDLHKSKKDFCTFENGGLEDAIKSSDIFIGVSKGNLLTEKMVLSMNNDPIIFALANPIPEIMPELAKKAGARIVATGRSDFPNQINNVLVFPGFFRGLLDSDAINIDYKMKISVAENLANLVKEPTEEKIISSPFDKDVAEVVAKTVFDYYDKNKGELI